MKLIITGSEGAIGRRLKAAFPGCIGIDVASTAEIVVDLATVDYEAPEIRAAFAGADGLIHLATSANPDAPDAMHFEAVVNTSRLVAACRRYDLKRLVLASSDWAQPNTSMIGINTYGHSKRVVEALAAMYAHATGHRAVGLRFGWVPHDASALAGAPEWLLANHWDDHRLIAEVRSALGLA